MPPGRVGVVPGQDPLGCVAWAQVVLVEEYDMVKFLAGLRSVALLIARVALGGILIAHGFDRWQVRRVASQIDYLNSYGVPYADWAAWGSIVLELVGGIFLVVGALVPLVALAVVAQQVLIIAYISWRRGPWLLNSSNTYVGGYEYNVALGSLALLLAVFGGGAVAIDRLFRRKKTPEDEDDEPTSTGPTRAPAPGSTGTTPTVTMPAARPTTYTPPPPGSPTPPNQFSSSGARVNR
jgi:putative oxidoreductase